MSEKHRAISDIDFAWMAVVSELIILATRLLVIINLPQVISGL